MEASLEKQEHNIAAAKVYRYNICTNNKKRWSIVSVIMYKFRWEKGFSSINKWFIDRFMSIWKKVSC